MPERVGDAAHATLGIHQQHIEAHAGQPPVRVLDQHDVAGSYLPRLLTGREGGGGLQ